MSERELGNDMGQQSWKEKSLWVVSLSALERSLTGVLLITPSENERIAENFCTGCERDLFWVQIGLASQLSSQVWPISRQERPGNLPLSMYDMPGILEIGTHVQIFAACGQGA